MTLSPTLASAGGLKSYITDLSVLEAHITIPLDLNPLKGLALRLVITQTFPVIPSMGIIPYKPEAIYLNSVSPTSISSHHNLSESGCFQTFFNSPTLISKFYSKKRGSVASNKGTSTFF